MSTSRAQPFNLSEESLNTIKYEDFLVELQTEELPPKTLFSLAEDFYAQVKNRLVKAELGFKDIFIFATPRRLGLLIENLGASQADQFIERKGPAKQAAFDSDGRPTPACLGFARSCGVTPDQLQIISVEEGEWVSFRQHVLGKPVAEVMPEIIEQALNALFIARRMRWGNSAAQFVRPVHSLIMLYGDTIVPSKIFDCVANRITKGHRFHAPDALIIPHAASYSAILEREGFVIPDHLRRKEKIREQLSLCVKNNLSASHPDASVLITSEEFLNEVAGLVEWPVALCGKFSEEFLQIPQEVLISSMQDHQRYFPVVDSTRQLLPFFILIANIDSQEPERVIKGNERVLRARLADAAFFYNQDKQESLELRTLRLKKIVNQAKLGTLFDKATRVDELISPVAKNMQLNVAKAQRVSLLAKSDLTTNLVNEFPELQGIIGAYYALHDGEDQEVAVAIGEQYLPRFGGDELPSSKLGQAIAIADRVDTLVGAFGINQIPTGDKDPYGLRRASIGLFRILIEKEIPIDLEELLNISFATYKGALVNKNAVSDLITFMQERLRHWYQEQGIAMDVFAAVLELGMGTLCDGHARILAVQEFKQLAAAQHLSAANKRVSNILAKYSEAFGTSEINPKLFESEAEHQLALAIAKQEKLIPALSEQRDYAKILLQLAELRAPVDDFFLHVMVMVEDKVVRENRLLLLKKLRNLFLHVADIALLN